MSGVSVSSMKSELSSVWHNKAWTSVLRKVFSAIWLAAVYWCKNRKCFCFCILLALSDKTARRQWVRLSVLSAALLGPVCITLSRPWAAASLVLSNCLDSCSHKLTYSFSLSASIHSNVRTQPHSNRPGFVLPEVNSHIGSNSTYRTEWTSLSHWLAFDPRLDQHESEEPWTPVSQTSVSVDSAFLFVSKQCLELPLQRFFSRCRGRSDVKDEERFQGKPLFSFC